MFNVLADDRNIDVVSGFLMRWTSQPILPFQTGLTEGAVSPGSACPVHTDETEGNFVNRELFIFLFNDGPLFQLQNGESIRIAPSSSLLTIRMSG